MAPLAPQQLLALLGKGQVVPAIFLLGKDSYLREMCRRKIIDQYVAPGVRDWGITRFSAADDDAPAILGQAQTLPMLAPQQVIFVSDVDAWERLGDASRDAMVKQLSEYFDRPVPFSVLVFEAEELDQRMRLAKILMEKTLVVSVDLSSDPAERSKLAGPVAFEMAQELGVILEEDAADELLELLDAELTAVRTEIEKLAAYVGERGRITRADVELLVVSSRKYQVWDLTEMLASRRVTQSLEFLDNLLREGEAPAQLVGALAWMYRKLLEAQEVPANAPDWQAARRLGMRPAMAQLAVRQSRKFPKAQLSRGLAALYEADSRLKSGGTSQQAVMEFLVAQLAAASPS
jgi:DNA polymerase-3 subunit delta